MTSPIFPRILARASDILTAAVYRITDPHNIARGLVVLCRERGEEIAHLRRHLTEARRIAHEQEDRAEQIEILAESRGAAVKRLSDRIANAEERTSAEMAARRLADDRARMWQKRAHDALDAFEKEKARGERAEAQARIEQNERDAVEERLSDARAEVASLTTRLAYAEAKAPNAEDVAAAKAYAAGCIPDSIIGSLLLRLVRVEVATFAKHEWVTTTDSPDACPTLSSDVAKGGTV